MTRLGDIAFVVTGLLLVAAAESRTGSAPVAHGVGHRRALLHAHNCYPDRGRWADRLDRAMATGLPVAIEQDLVWVPPAGAAPGRSVVAHDAPAQGNEPTLEEHFFEKVKPLMERALAEKQRDRWPAVVLHLDFKTNEREHHDAVWAILGKYEAWLTTADRSPDGAQTSPLVVGPLLVLTENGEGQERDFHDRRAVGSRLRAFGTVPPQTGAPPDDPKARASFLADAPVEALIPSGATSYRRWTNHSWWVVERGGQAASGDWTEAEAARLRSLVSRAHGLGLWIRLYALNGHEPGAGMGWSAGYNMGSLDAVRARWRAAIEATVDFIATDQYEDFARELGNKVDGLLAHAQQSGPQHAALVWPPGLVARTNALMKRPSIFSASATRSGPALARKAFASSTR
jgi:hypothetical protein